MHRREVFGLRDDIRTIEENIGSELHVTYHFDRSMCVGAEF